MHVNALFSTSSEPSSDISEKPNLTWLDAAQVLSLPLYGWPTRFFKVVVIPFFIMDAIINFSFPDGFGGSRAPYAHQGDQATNHRQGPYSIKVYVILIPILISCNSLFIVVVCNLFSYFLWPLFNQQVIKWNCVV